MNLPDLLQKYGLTTEWLAEQTGILKRTLDQYKRSGVPLAQAPAEHVVLIADALGKHPRDVIYPSEEKLSFEDFKAIFYNGMSLARPGVEISSGLIDGQFYAEWPASDGEGKMALAYAAYLDGQRKYVI